jgi:CRISPR locus-related DNA-binding protein
MPGSSCIKVFTFGWSPELVIRPLVEEGISRDEPIVLVTNKPETEYARKRFEEAYQQVVTFLRMAGVDEVRYVEVDLEGDFLDVCLNIVRTIRSFHGDCYKFYLTGGMRLLVAAALIVARLLLTAGTRVEVRLSMEDRPVLYSVPAELLTLDLGELTEAQLELLKYLRSLGRAGFEDLAIGRASTTARKLLTKLRGKGLVEYRNVGRKQVYKLTKIGELVLALLG